MRAHLTITHNLETELAIVRTVRGQACWAQGPDRCGRCEHWVRLPSVCGTVGAYTCGKYQTMMRVKFSPRVPGLTPACKYFVMQKAGQ